MSIYKKLLKIQSEIKGLSKDKSSHNYQYVTGNKLLSFIKPIMDEQGLILKQEILSIENTRQDYKTKYNEKSEILSKVMMRFTWVDCETGDTDVNLFGANGQNDWEKGLGSALTYGERYFLLKYFHIATDEDDIDNPERKPINEAPQQSVITPISKEKELPWLNEYDKEGKLTAKFANVEEAIRKGNIKSLADVRKHYKISKEVAATIEKLLTT